MGKEYIMKMRKLRLKPKTISGRLWQRPWNPEKERFVFSEVSRFRGYPVYTMELTRRK